METTRRRATAFLIVLLTAAAVKQAVAQTRPAEEGPTKAALLAPERLKQGDPLLLWALSDRPLEGAEAVLLSAKGKRLAAAAAFAGPSFTAQAVFRAYGFLMAIPVDLAPGSYRVAAKAVPRVAATKAGEGAGSVPAAPPIELSAVIVVEARNFPSEDIGLDEANSRLRREPDARKEEEARALAELLGRADPDAVFLDGSAFMIPLVPRRKSAGFGDRRRYLFAGGGSEASLHAGLDLAVDSGTEVLACGPGKVVMTADRAVTGFTVVVEHLPGLYSLYMHLDSIAARAGQVVERGEALGLSGSTGLSTGPHLHWEVRARGQAVDPEYWLSRPPLDKDRAATIIHALIEGR